MISPDNGTPVPVGYPAPVKVEDTTPKEPLIATVTGVGTFVRPAEK